MREGVIKLAYGKAEVSVTLPVDNLEIVKPKKVNLAQSQKSWFFRQSTTLLILLPKGSKDAKGKKYVF